MAMKRTFVHDADDGKSMTLGELRALINDTADLMSAQCEVKVRVGFGGGLKSITITTSEPYPPRPQPGTDPWN
jgi:hypothetical protein